MCGMQSTMGTSDRPRNSENEFAVDGRLYRLLEINQEMAALRCEQEQILKSLLTNSEPELSFDDQRRRIYWEGGSVKLGKKSYLFVKTVWRGENHQAEFAELEENVWLRHAETEEMFVDRCTVSMLARHTQKNLNEAHFPYLIEPIKNFSGRELEGFRFVFPGQKKKILPQKPESMI